jgi:hypothetical protein
MSVEECAAQVIRAMQPLLLRQIVNLVTHAIV